MRNEREGTRTLPAQAREHGWTPWMMVLGLATLVLCLVWLAAPSKQHTQQIETLREAVASLRPAGSDERHVPLKLPFQ